MTTAPIQNPETRAPIETNVALDGSKLTPEEVDDSIAVYSAYRDENDEAVKIGLYGEDLEQALLNPDTVLTSYETADGKTVKVSLLVPAEGLEWYNLSLLRSVYGQDTPLYYYAHPPISEKPELRADFTNALKAELDKGSVIFMDQYHQDGAGTAEELQSIVGEDYSVDRLGGDETRESQSVVFAGPVNFPGVESVHSAPSITEAYKQAVTDGEIVGDGTNGASLIEVIEGEEAEKLWQLYDKPFQDLGQDHPSNAGFDQKGLMEILADPSVAKLVNRVDGQITTLCIFVQDFEHYPWFNNKFYADNYPEYFNTGNVLIFPGIVSDENLKGASYSSRLVSLATQLYAKRGSNVLVTFECTEISATYIPKIVNRAINHGGYGTISGIENPISLTEYRVLRKTT